MRVRIEIDTKTFVRFWLVIIGFVALGYMLYSAKTALIILATSAFLALCLSRPVERFADAMPGKSRLAGTAIAFSLVIFLLAVVLVVMVPPIIDQTIYTAASIPYFLDVAQQQWPVFSEIVARYHLQGYVDSTIASIRASTNSFAYDLGSSAFVIMGSFAKVLVASFLTIVLTFLMLLEGPRWFRALWDMYHDIPKRELHKSQAKRMHAVVTGYVTGQVVLAGLSALTVGLVVFALNYGFEDVSLELVLPVTAAVFVCSLIPIFGPFIAGVSVTIVLAFGDLAAAGLFAAFFVFYQQLQLRIVAPIVQTRVVEMTPLFVLASVVLGFYMYGVIGAVVAVPIAGCLKVIVEDYLHHSDKMRSVSRFVGTSPLASLVKKKKA